MISVFRDIGGCEVFSHETAVVCFCVGDADVLGEHGGSDGIRDGELVADDFVLLEVERCFGGCVAAGQGCGGERGRGCEDEVASGRGFVALHENPSVRMSVLVRGLSIGFGGAGFEDARKLRDSERASGRCDRHLGCDRPGEPGSAGFPDGRYAVENVFSARRAWCPWLVGVIG